MGKGAQGEIVQVIGLTVDIRFPPHQLPPILVVDLLAPT